MNEPHHIQFSIRWLLIVTSVVAVLIAVLMQLGERGGVLILPVAFGTIIYIMYFVQRTAAQKQKVLPFWQATFAYVMFLPLMTGPLRLIRDSDVIAASFILGIGLMLSLVALLRGNWVTRIYVAPIAAIWMCLVFFKISSSFRSWNFLWNYWMEPESY